MVAKKLLAEPTSAQQAHDQRRECFWSEHDATCPCPVVQLREENALLLCARCDRPIVRRSKSSERANLVLRAERRVELCREELDLALQELREAGC